jgi:hypothetical protein
MDHARVAPYLFGVSAGKFAGKREIHFQGIANADRFPRPEVYSPLGQIHGLTFENR